MTVTENKTDAINPTSLPLQSPAAGAKSDPFDLSSLRLGQDYSSVGVKKKLITVPVRKPTRGEFVRVHPDPAYRLDVLFLELQIGQQKELYLVGPAVRDGLAAESCVRPWRVMTAANRQGVAFLWPLRLPNPDKEDKWADSGLEIAGLAQERWVRVNANMSLGAYEVFEAVGDLSEPVWPTESFQDLVRVGFGGRLINDRDHPVLKGLRGEL